jgi:hypothetical protein
MTGGLLNIVSHGTSNLLIYGNPQKTFFKSSYKSITNFGLQKFRIDYEGSRVLRMNEQTEMNFKIPRYGDLLNEMFLVINLPDIWSPLYYNTENQEWTLFGFKWIKNLGANIIKEVEFHCGGNTLAKYSGEYLSLAIQRDASAQKKQLWDEMTGNVVELNNPGKAFNRNNAYPNAYYHGTTNIRPSIQGRKLYIPIDAWFGLLNKTAFPLISLQYQELNVKITLRPIRELYIIRDVLDTTYNYPYVSPNPNIDTQQLYRFVNPPEDSYGNVTSTNNFQWNADIHLISTYTFLDNEERRQFSAKPQKFLIKDIYDWEFLNTTGSKVVKLDSKGMVSSYMFRFRRSDVFMRNEWSNYTNWPYEYPPYKLENSYIAPYYDTPDINYFTTGNFDALSAISNLKNILLNMAFVIDGKYRENIMDQGVYNYVEKYNRTNGGLEDGVYIYNLGLETNNYNYQPTGAMNMDKFNNITFEINTLEPPIDPSAAYVNLCDEDGNIIGTRKNLWDLNEYNYDLTIFEERYNVIHIESGMCGLLYAR